MIGSPGDRHRDRAAQDHASLWHPFTAMSEWCSEDPVIVVAGEGNELIDDRGNRYLDGVSSLWVNLHGHRRPEIDEAVEEQLHRIAHSTFLGLTHPAAIELGRKLLDLAPGRLGRLFYSDSGSTAVEIALKMAFQYWKQHGEPWRQRFVAFRNGYHGDTIGSVSVGGIDLFHEIYRPLLFPAEKAESAYCYRCPLGKTFPSCDIACLDSLRGILDRVGREVAAVVLEPGIQGAGGMIAFPEGFTRGVFELTREAGALFIADEVATGFGRTGALFASELERIEPDILAAGKGLTGGYLPLAVTLTTEEIYEAFLGPYEELRTFYHGHSYTANPLGCAAALASLGIFEREEVLDQVRGKAALFGRELERFRELPSVGDVRSLGLMAGIELVRDREARERYAPGERIGHQVICAARRRGVILRPLGDVIVILPPLSIREEELRRILDVAYESIREVTGP